MRRSENCTIFLAMYVDDISLTGNDLTKISALKDFLDEKFRIKDLGLLNYFFGNTGSLSSVWCSAAQKEVHL